MQSSHWVGVWVRTTTNTLLVAPSIGSLTKNFKTCPQMHQQRHSRGTQNLHFLGAMTHILRAKNPSFFMVLGSKGCSGFAIFNMFMSPVSTSPKTCGFNKKHNILSLYRGDFFCRFFFEISNPCIFVFPVNNSKNLVFFSKFWLDGLLFLVVSQLKPPRRRPVSLFLPPSWILRNFQNQSRQRP